MLDPSTNPEIPAKKKGWRRLPMDIGSDGHTSSLPTDLKTYAKLLERKETEELEAISISTSESSCSEGDEPEWAEMESIRETLAGQSHAQLSALFLCKQHVQPPVENMMVWFLKFKITSGFILWFIHKCRECLHLRLPNFVIDQIAKISLTWPQLILESMTISFKIQKRSKNSGVVKTLKRARIPPNNFFSYSSRKTLGFRSICSCLASKRKVLGIYRCVESNSKSQSSKVSCWKSIKKWNRSSISLRPSKRLTVSNSLFFFKLNK